MLTPQPGPERAALEHALGSPFSIWLDDDRAVPLTLVELHQSPARAGWECFSLLFEGPDPPVFGQGTYRTEHPAIGTFPLFVVPVWTDAEGQHYEAVINRPTPDGRPLKGVPGE